MIKEVIGYGAECDNCKKDWVNDCMGWGSMSDEVSMKHELSNDDWLSEGDKHYCPDCWSYDDNEVIDESRKDLHKK
ncbi:hypothetical protein V6R21_06355 [Limibacter armeniacum]|uniref:hypothetical protein n=1 Tax=Limibacter armeniacum TaxID=466084 RepID=UPI002FE5010E